MAVRQNPNKNLRNLTEVCRIFTRPWRCFAGVDDCAQDAEGAYSHWSPVGTAVPHRDNTVPQLARAESKPTAQ